MNSKVILRCTLISLLLSIPSPLLIGLLITLISSVLATDLTWFLNVEGVSAMYAATVIAVFIVLWLGTLAMARLAPVRLCQAMRSGASDIAAQHR